MKLKKRAIPMLAGVLTAVMLTSTASAHPYDYWQGKYIGKSNAEILFRIDTSAQTDLLTWAGVYQYGYDWNNISSKVKVSLALAGPGTPSIYGAMSVMGQSFEDGTLGRTIPYDSNANIMIKGNEYDVDSNWASVRIYMNTNPNAFDCYVSSTISAKKTFIHEIGHALKLKHPDRYEEGHNYYSGYPHAVMNPKPPDYRNLQSAKEITDHDKSCLIAKWGA